MNFRRTAKLLSAAATVVLTEFGLFGKFLTKLAPPVHDVDIKVGIACLTSLLIFLAIAVLAKKQTRSLRRNLAIVSVLFFVAGIGCYFWYEYLQGEYVYRFPPVTGAEGSERYIRGEYHEEGKIRLGGQSLSAAIADLGGLDWVINQQLLWHEESQRHIELLLTGVYLILSVSLGVALFSLITLATSPNAKELRKPSKTT